MSDRAMPQGTTRKNLDPLRVMVVYGTRPEAIKMASVITELRNTPDMLAIVVVTGQHREMLDQVNQVFGIEPDHDLDIMSDNQSLNGVVQRVIMGLDRLLVDESPDVVVVQGDTSTVMAAAVASFNRRIPVVHMEAGLRTGNKYSPFPEEANRRLTTQVTDLHLTPTAESRGNLLREHVSDADIVVTGNSVIDALMLAVRIPDVQWDDPRLEGLVADVESGKSGPILLVTTHRRENLGEPMAIIGRALGTIADHFPDVRIVVPMHRNPAVREALLAGVADRSGVILTEPLEYAQFTRILSHAHIVLTDSGGVQEEAPSLGKPVLVMRDTTERPEAVAAGTAQLVGTDHDQIVASVQRLLQDPSAYQAMARAANPFGDGMAARRTVDAIRWRFAAGERPVDFVPAGTA